MSFTDKQQAFIDHYLTCWNATEAAKLAGYSEKTAYSIGHENLNKPEIKEEIQKRVSELTMTADEALVLMTEIARGDLSKVKNVEDAGALLKKYKKTKHRDGSISEEIELYPKDAALRDILKIHGKYGPLGTDDDPIQHRVKFIDYGLTKDDDTDTN